MSAGEIVMAVMSLAIFGGGAILAALLIGYAILTRPR